MFASQESQLGPLRHISPQLSSFLGLLRDKDITNIVVLGGAVRDILLGQQPQDIDIAVKIQAPPDAKQYRYGHFDSNLQLIPNLMPAFQPLACALGVSIDDLVKGQAVWQGLSIDLLGLRPVANSEQTIMLPDIYVDSRSEQVFHYVPLSLSINQMALGPRGEIYDNGPGRADLANKVGRVINGILPNPSNEYNMTHLLRLAYYQDRFSLTFEPASLEFLSRYAQVLTDDLSLWRHEPSRNKAGSNFHKYYRWLFPGQALPTSNDKRALEKLAQGSFELFTSSASPPES